MRNKIIIIVVALLVIIMIAVGIYFGLIRQRAATQPVASTNQNQSAIDTAKDTDGDGVLDYKEIEMGLNLNNKDTDQDGIDDGFEKEWGTDPLVADTDQDGITDGDEVKQGLDPLRKNKKIGEK